MPTYGKPQSLIEAEAKKKEADNAYKGTRQSIKSIPNNYPKTRSTFASFFSGENPERTDMMNFLNALVASLPEKKVVSKNYRTGMTKEDLTNQATQEQVKRRNILLGSLAYAAAEIIDDYNPSSSWGNWLSSWVVSPEWSGLYRQTIAGLGINKYEDLSDDQKNEGLTALLEYLNSVASSDVVWPNPSFKDAVVNNLSLMLEEKKEASKEITASTTSSSPMG